MPGINSDFLASIKRYGVSKTSHFQLTVPLRGSTIAKQQGPQSKFSDISRLLAFRCEVAELPGRQLVSNDSRTYGPTYKTPYQSLYQEISLNFLETANLLIRDFFELWLSSIYNPATNLLAYPNSFRFDCTLTQYDITQTEAKDPNSPLVPVAEWKLRNSFPTAVNQMPLAWSEDGFHRVAVTLAYEYYTLSTLGLVPSETPISSPQVPPKGSSNS